jgi:hypothetical protein
MNKIVNVYKIMPITKKDVLNVLNLLKNNYFHDEPLNASTMLIEENASVIQLENYCKSYLDKGELMYLITWLYNHFTNESYYRSGFKILLKQYIYIFTTLRLKV